jgi:hypothetical protein
VAGGYGCAECCSEAGESCGARWESPGVPIGGEWPGTQPVVPELGGGAEEATGLGRRSRRAFAGNEMATLMAEASATGSEAGEQRPAG